MAGFSSFVLSCLDLVSSVHDQDCDGACHLKNYSFYHLPTQGRAGVKLGDVDTLQMYL